MFSSLPNGTAYLPNSHEYLPTGDALATTSDVLAPAEDALTPTGHVLIPTEDALTPTGDALIPTGPVSNNLYRHEVASNTPVSTPTFGFLRRCLRVYRDRCGVKHGATIKTNPPLCWALSPRST